MKMSAGDILGLSCLKKSLKNLRGLCEVRRLAGYGGVEVRSSHLNSRGHGADHGTGLAGRCGDLGWEGALQQTSRDDLTLRGNHPDEHP